MKLRIFITVLLIVFTTKAWALVSQKMQYEVTYPSGLCVDPITTGTIVPSEWDVEVKINGTTLLTAFDGTKFELRILTLGTEKRLFVNFTLSGYANDIFVGDRIDIKLKWTPGCGGGASYSAKKTYTAGSKSSRGLNVYYVNFLQAAGGGYDGEGIELKGAGPEIVMNDSTICAELKKAYFSGKISNPPANYTISWKDASWNSLTPATTTGTTADTSILQSLEDFSTYAAGTYTLHAILNDGTNDVDTADFQLTVKQKPDAGITPNEICAGKTISATGGGSYQWIKGSTATTASITPSKTDKYAVEVTKDGCKDTAEVTVTVNPLPKVDLTSDKMDVCVVGTVTLTATPSLGTTPYGDYTWTGNGTSGKNATSSGSVTANGNNIYTVTLKDAKGCVSIPDTVIVKGHKVNAGLAANPTTVTNGNQSDLTATPAGAANYDWSLGDAVVGTGDKVKTKPLATTGNYQVVVEDAYGCKDTASVSVTVSGSGLAIDPRDEDVCTGGLPITLSAGESGGSGNYSYTWTAPAGVVLDNTTAKTPKVETTSLPGTYTVGVKVTDVTTSVSKTDSLQLVITETPKLSNLVASATTVTSGDTSHLSVSVTPSIATVTWTGGAVNPSTGLSVTAGPLTATTTYTVKATNGNCSATDNITITVSGLPLSVNPKPLDICTASLPGFLDAGEKDGTGPYKYAWTAPAGVVLDDATAKNPKVETTSLPGTYTVDVKVTDSKGVSKTGSLQLVITETPKLSNLVASATTVTSGDTSHLSVSVTPSAATVTWTGGAVNPSTGLSVTAGPLTATTTYTVTATNGNCTATDNITINVGSSPFVVTPPTSVPTGPVDTGIPVCVSVTGGDCNGNYTYDWTTSETGVTVTDNGAGCATVTATTPGLKRVCVDVSCGTDTKNVCIDVIVTDSSSECKPELIWSVTPAVCANSADSMTITFTATGCQGATYSFVLSDKSARTVMNIVNETGPTWTHTVGASGEGTYTVSGFQATTADGSVKPGNISPKNLIEVKFYPVPVVTIKGLQAGSNIMLNCQGEPLVLEGTGTASKYVWDNGDKIFNGVPFIPEGSGTHILLSKNEFECVRMDTIEVVVNPKPEVQITAQGTEICPGDPVVLTATATLGASVTWNNGVVDGVPFRPTLTADYVATAKIQSTGCSATDSVRVVVNMPPKIIRTSRNPRNIAIGKDVYFAVTATGSNLAYQWMKKVNNQWIPLSDINNTTPMISGTRTDSLVLKQVPLEWDGSEFKCLVTGDCGQDSAVFQLGVRECFEIEVELVMQDGIIPDTDPDNKIDGWYCIGTRIALRAIVTSPEGYDIENAHFKWTIDGLDLPEEHTYLETDTAVLSWIPEYQEDDIVVKVCAYSDGACEEICPQYLRLKARPFEDVSLKLLTSRDPDHRFCPGDTVDFWVVSKNGGAAPAYEWYNDIFKLPEEESPRNKLVHYENGKITLAMGQEDTWVKVYMTPSAEVCTDKPVFVDTVFMRKKNTVHPSLKIINNINDTVACQGDRILFTAVYENAGYDPLIQWRKDIWDLGTGQFAEAELADKDMWIKCTLKPGDDVCYDGEVLIDTMVIRVLEQSEVTISADMEGKQPGDEIVVESEVKNMPVDPHYEWYVNSYMATDYEPQLISSEFRQGDVIVCAVSGEKICQRRVFSNELVIDFGNGSRDTVVTIYKGEEIRGLSLYKPGDDDYTFTITERAMWGFASLSPDGKNFTYRPNGEMTGTDMVEYEVRNRFDKNKVEKGYVYIRILDQTKYFIPNIITPNGDGLNDTWKLDFLADYPDHLITVYNRNGKIVFQAKNYQSDWDGSGEATSGYVSHFNLSNGIYTYVIKLGDKVVLKNWLEIRRDMNRGKYK